MSCPNCDKLSIEPSVQQLYAKRLRERATRSCAKCNAYKVGGEVMVNGGQHTGRIVKTHQLAGGEHRYRVRWFHPSESQPQHGWFDHGDIQ